MIFERFCFFGRRVWGWVVGECVGLCVVWGCLVWFEAFFRLVVESFLLGSVFVWLRVRKWLRIDF